MPVDRPCRLGSARPGAHNGLMWIAPIAALGMGLTLLAGPAAPMSPVAVDGRFVATASLAAAVVRAVEATPLPSPYLVGQSVRGRKIMAVRQGDPAAKRVLLVIGQIHGNEPAGRSVITRLRATKVPADTAIWTITSVNPDGSAAGKRRNARGVDLNRNFPTKWQPKAFSPSRNPGPSPASEPETKAVMAFINKLRPDGVITFHQALFAVDTSDPRTEKWATMLANGIKLPMKSVPCGGVCGGTMGQWVIAKHYSASTGSGWSVVVELPGSPVASKWITRSVRTVVRVAAAQHP